ncbi:MAG: prepilin-type N-terminal cleavage/methylation domain-containing protein [Pseudomonadota bacterium]|nr:prepilin-type N-terminal cleavage/methylation domain-containing protein [Pseudomonadota bacterium]
MRQAGLSMIELMIVILLIGLLALAASPFTGAWVQGANVNKTLALLEQAVGSAKASALRNAAGIRGQDAAIALCLSNRDLRLVPAAAVANCAAPAALWSAQVPTGVQVKIAAADWTCSCFTNRGLLTTTDASCNACGSSLEFTVAAGGESETLTIY